MRGVSITGLGAFTPVGVNIPQTMGSLVSRLQWFDDLDLRGPTGAPVSGARVRLSSVENAADRYVAMSRFALAECRESGSSSRGAGEPVPLMLATSRARDLPCRADILLERVLDGDEETADGRNGQRMDRAASRVFADGRLGALHALAAAQEVVSSGRASGCYVGGVDSLLDPVRLYELLDQGRLLDGSGSDGFVPGEAAAFLKVESRGVRGGSTVLASAAAEEPAAPRDGLAEPATGAALARAAIEALRAAELDPSKLGALVHDGASEPATVEEIAMAMSRLPFSVASPLRPWAPAYSVGEAGAAAAWLSLAMTAFFLREGVFEGPALVWLMSEGSRRAALVLGPHDAKEKNRG